jgi:peptidyl-prolyl cis-trans isomerase B (cyclophilin B)
MAGAEAGRHLPVQVPTFSPGAKARQMNAVASFLGDDRAAKARAKWGRPLKAVVITDGGALKS